MSPAGLTRRGVRGALRTPLRARPNPIWAIQKGGAGIVIDAPYEQCRLKPAPKFSELMSMTMLRVCNHFSITTIFGADVRSQQNSRVPQVEYVLYRKPIKSVTLENRLKIERDV